MIDLKTLLHRKGATVKEKLLAILYFHKDAISLSGIREVAKSNGAKDVLKVSSISSVLSRAKHYTINVNRKWELTEEGRLFVEETFNINARKRTHKVEHDLRALLANIPNAEARAFMEEAVKCMEQELWKASVIMSWCGTISILQHYAALHHLSEVNAEALSRNPKWTAAKNAHDLGGMKESVFLDILSKLSVITKNVKAELVHCLDRRNSCGHPTAYLLSEATVASHIELLILNVFNEPKYFSSSKP